MMELKHKFIPKPVSNDRKNHLPRIHVQDHPLTEGDAVVDHKIPVDPLTALNQEEILEEEVLANEDDHESPEKEHLRLWRTLMNQGSGDFGQPVELSEGLVPFLVQTGKIDGLSSSVTFDRFITLVSALQDLMLRLWQEDNRVASMKIAIQAAKTLGDPANASNAQYPRIFVLLSDLINRFGQLVYDRLVSMCPNLTIGFRANDVDPTVQELAKNWLFKIVSIRELIPRLLLEMAFLKCHRLLEEDAPNLKGIGLITRSIRGVANVTVSSYIRSFLVLQSFTVSRLADHKQVSKVAKLNFAEALSFLKGSNQWQASYLALKWLLKVQLMDQTFTKQVKVLDRCLEKVNLNKESGSSVLLRLVLETAPPEYIKDNIEWILGMIATKDDVEIVLTLGQSMDSVVISDRGVRTSVLNSIWGVIGTLDDVTKYLGCVKHWIGFVASHGQKKEVDKVFGDIHRHISAATDQVLTSSSRSEITFIIVNTISKYPGKISTLLGLASFLSAFDLIEAEQKVCLAKRFITRFQDEMNGNRVSDPVVVSALMKMGQILTSSINALSVQDETRQISQIICQLLCLVQSDSDLEAQFKVATEARAKFSRLNSVQILLICSVNTLAQKACPTGNGSEALFKAKRLQQACCAFAFITIPTLRDPLVELDLTVAAAHTALKCRCFHQFNDFIMSFVAVLGRLSHSSDADGRVVASVSKLLSVLSLAPRRCGLEPAKAVFDATLALPLTPEGRTAVFCRMIQYLSVIATVANPISNSAGDLNDEAFETEINSVGSEILALGFNFVDACHNKGQIKAAAKAKRELNQTIQRFLQSSPSDLKGGDG